MSLHTVLQHARQQRDLLAAEHEVLHQRLLQHEADVTLVRQRCSAAEGRCEKLSDQGSQLAGEWHWHHATVQQCRSDLSQVVRAAHATQAACEQAWESLRAAEQQVRAIKRLMDRRHAVENRRDRMEQRLALEEWMLRANGD